MREKSSPDRAETEGLGSEGLEPGAAGTRPSDVAAPIAQRQPLTEAEIVTDLVTSLQRALEVGSHLMNERDHVRALAAIEKATTRSPKP